MSKNVEYNLLCDNGKKANVYVHVGSLKIKGVVSDMETGGV